MNRSWHKTLESDRLIFRPLSPEGRALIYFTLILFSVLSFFWLLTIAFQSSVAFLFLLVIIPPLCVLPVLIFPLSRKSILDRKDRSLTVSFWILFFPYKRKYSFGPTNRVLYGINTSGGRGIFRHHVFFEQYGRRILITSSTDQNEALELLKEISDFSQLPIDTEATTAAINWRSPKPNEHIFLIIPGAIGFLVIKNFIQAMTSGTMKVAFPIHLADSALWSFRGVMISLIHVVIIIFCFIYASLIIQRK